jgi:nucleoside-diphosphate-sugar epimerase
LTIRSEWRGGAPARPLIRSNAAGAVNIGSGEPVTVQRVIEAIGDTVGRQDVLGMGTVRNNRTSRPRSHADKARLRSLGWAPSYSLEHVEHGIADVVEWWLSRAAATTG